MAGQTQIIPENLPVGWKFDPSAEETIDYYSILPQLLSQPNPDFYIKVIQLSNYDPWDLFAKFKSKSGEKELYFFTPCEYYNSNGLRKRKAGSGHWKSTGDPRLIILGDSGSVIGTKRTLVFHNPDPTEFVITEFVPTADSSLPFKKGFVLCKLKKKPKKYKSTSKKPKKAEPDCKKKTRPNKKARKTESSNGNSMLAAALTSENRNAKMICNSTYSEGEQSNYMVSYSEDQDPNKTTSIPAYDEGQLTYLTSTQTMYGKKDNPTCYNDEPTYPIVNQLTATSSFNKGKEEGLINLDFDSQNPTKNTDISVSQEGEWNPCMVAPFDFDNQNQYNDMSGDYWSSILGSIGDSTIQGVQSGKKDMPILEDDQVSLTTFDLADDASPNIDVQQWLEKYLEL